ncbi:MAG: tetratricopeptide (TPR) repeat protein [Pseudohongiellaceae bacterium]|jgi:tetratricopeptide (TPR) repeat protein
MELTIEQALQQSLAAHKAGNLEEAERLYRTILRVQPAHPDANHNLGLIAVSINEVVAALPLFKNALEANPKIEQFWLSYVDALIKQNQPETAKKVLAQAKMSGVASERLDALSRQATSNKSPHQSRLNSLLELYQNGQYNEAEKLSVLITQQFPEHQFAWKVLGAVFRQTGRKPEAINAIQKVMQLSPQDAQTHSSLGNMLRELGRFEEAQLSCKQAIALKPDFAEAHNNLGAALQGLGRLEEAQASYRQAIALNSNFAEAHSNLGGTLRELGRLEEAELSCRQAVALESDSALAHCDLGIMLRELGRLEEAQASYRQAIALKPDFAEAHNSLGGTLRELGRLEEAQLSYRQAIALKSDFALAHSNLGVTLKDLGRLEEAGASCRQAIALQPDFAGARYNLGMLLFESGQYQAAAEQFALVDIHQSKFYAIQCSYHQDEEPIFFKKLDSLINQGEINAVIGSLGCSSEIKYGIKKSNPFCNDPLKHIVKTDLNDQCDFKNIFIKTATDILMDNLVSSKAQVHLTNGTQTAGNIFALEKVSSTEIENIIHAEIEKYRIRFKDSKEGFIKNWPASYNISGWLVCMQSGGKLAAHMHDTGWITGSVYINVPPKSKTDSGNLVLCVSDQGDALGVESSQISIIDVVTGSLCLFPSSLHHYTVPFEEEENRIVLAFDVIPVD